MPSFINLADQRFGRLTVLGRSRNQGRRVAWSCVCDCGETTVVAADKLRNGETTSCGCYQRERVAARATTHGHCALDDGPSPTYVTWSSMIQRTTNPNADRWPYYGARGITVCDRWRTFAAFLADMGERPEGMSLDRIDNDGNYEPGNCRWATHSEQELNKRPRQQRVA